MSYTTDNNSNQFSNINPTAGNMQPMAKRVKNLAFQHTPANSARHDKPT